MPGARCARKPRVQKIVVVSTRVGQVTPEIVRHSPRNGFTAYSALSPATGFLATVISWNCFPLTWCQHRGIRTTRLRRPRAASPVKRAARVHRIPPRVS